MDKEGVLLNSYPFFPLLGADGHDQFKVRLTRKNLLNTLLQEYGHAVADCLFLNGTDSGSLNDQLFDGMTGNHQFIETYHAFAFKYLLPVYSRMPMHREISDRSMKGICYCLA